MKGIIFTLLTLAAVCSASLLPSLTHAQEKTAPRCKTFKCFLKQYKGGTKRGARQRIMNLQPNRGRARPRIPVGPGGSF